MIDKIKRCLITYRCSCGNKLYPENTYNDDHDYMDYILCEYSIKCKKCNKIVGHWAYGSFEPPVDRLEELYMKWEDIKYRVKKLFVKKEDRDVGF